MGFLRAAFKTFLYSLVLSLLLPAVLFKLKLLPIGYINKLFPPHEIALALNPEFDWAHKLQKAVPQLRDEFLQKREAALRPRSAYVDEEYPGAVTDAMATEGWSTLYLRVGNVDTCLTRFFPETMKVLDNLGLRVHTAFFSELQPSRDDILPHCGQLRGLFRAITVLNGEKSKGAASIASMGVYHDHDMCLTRFASQCPKNLTTIEDGKVEWVHYNVGCDPL